MVVANPQAVGSARQHASISFSKRLRWCLLMSKSKSTWRACKGSIESALHAAIHCLHHGVQRVPPPPPPMIVKTISKTSVRLISPTLGNVSRYGKHFSFFPFIYSLNVFPSFFPPSSFFFLNTRICVH